ncbi:hypothetical protein LUZ61_007479 [Rhynchospora tenuis]|uniref:RING-type domain-containing protein n=1 Tax=Rhynchospora tenuis TaxID=198213 RepID=A0AAD5ZTJ1_9POAL|nr:hypothetical protein LUZ61_007479 [Rhynchospora tenuis]
MEASSSGTSETERQPCPICLAPINDEAYLDRCFHSFCYKCIGEWLSFVASKRSKPLSSFVCPLCKGQNSSIIHGVYGRSFQRHYASKDNTKRPLSDAHMLRFHVYNTNEDIGHNRVDVLQYWKKRKYLQKNTWVQNWLRREIQAILQEEDVDIILCHIYGTVESFMKKQEREGLSSTAEEKRDVFRSLLANAARPFLLEYTDQFVNEVELFIASGLNINAYDKACMKRLGWPACYEVRNNNSKTSELSKCNGVRNSDLRTSDLSDQDENSLFLGDDCDPDLVD